MIKKVSVKPTKANLVVGIIVASLFALFGIVFLVVLALEESYIGVGFMIFWILFVFILGGSFIYSLKNYRKGGNMVVEQVLEISEVDDKNKNNSEFDEKLRQLEKLKNEGFISADEFSIKRKEIMDQKW